MGSRRMSMCLTWAPNPQGGAHVAAKPAPLATYDAFVGVRQMRP